MGENENENMTNQTLWDAAEAVLRGKYIAIQAYFKKQDISQVHNLNFLLKVPGKGQPIKSKPAEGK